ncbi:MAG: ATP-dependent Clp protease ATP-binding subunit, partial [Bacteroidaceae bacterium]|nr:ATP-dependent Clp protease ATP-binding subunit [Bacteroidaceae bacterium]
MKKIDELNTQENKLVSEITPIVSGFSFAEDAPEGFPSEEGGNGGQDRASSQKNNETTTTTDTPTIKNYGTDLTKLAEEGLLDPVIGREKEIERIAQILSRRKKNNPILLGEPGVGKSAVVEGLATLIATRKVPHSLMGKKIVALDMTSIVAGTQYRGQFEERLRRIIQELREHKEIILFVDEIHTIIGAGGAPGSLDAANILKPALARGEVQCIGATTINEYKKSIEKD